MKKDEYAPFYPEGTERVNWMVDILKLKPGYKFMYLGKEMIISKIHKANKFLASPWGISPFNKDFYLQAEYLSDNGNIKTKTFDKWQIQNIFDEMIKRLF